jgi:hypothetical protein
MINKGTTTEASAVHVTRTWPSLPFATKPINEKWPLGKVRCVGRLGVSGNEEYLVNTRWWHANKSYARRYSNQSSAKMIATKYGGVVLRYHSDGHGNYYLRPS